MMIHRSVLIVLSIYVGIVFAESVSFDFGTDWYYSSLSDEDRKFWGLPGYVTGAINHTGEFSGENNLFVITIPERAAAVKLMVEVGKRMQGEKKTTINLRPLKRLNGVKIWEFQRSFGNRSLRSGIFQFSFHGQSLIVTAEFDIRTYDKIRPAIYKMVEDASKK